MPKLRELLLTPPEPKGDAEDQLRELRDYMERQRQELVYLLNHLEKNNTGSSIWDDIDAQIPQSYDSNPETDGVASPGTSNKWARGNHRHGTDMSRASANDLNTHVGDTANPHSVTKAQVGLSDVANERQYSALNPPPTPSATDVGAIPATEKGSVGGVAELDANGMVPSAQLPSYVDDVLEYASVSTFPATGESGKIYVAQDTNLTYRWSGSAYVEISPSLALGETSSTAYRGDRGKTAYDHSQVTSGNPHNVTAAEVGARPDTWTPSASDVGAQPTITASGMLKGDGLGGVSAATAGTDYQAPLTAGVDYQTPLVAGTDYQTPLTAGTDYATPAQIPTVPAISTSTPQMDGTGAAGSTGEVSDAGHTHPRDTNPFEATRIFNTVTDVHTDTTITLTENVAGYKLLYIELNTRSNNSSTYRMSLIFAASRPYNAMAIANSEYTGYVKLATVSGQPKQLRFQDTSATSLYVATVYGIR